MHLALLYLLFQAPATPTITPQQQLSISRAQTALALARANLKGAELAYMQAKEREAQAIAEIQKIAKSIGKPDCDFDELQNVVCEAQPSQKKGKQ